MKTTPQERKHTEKLLNKQGIRLHDIQRFSFMKRFHETAQAEHRAEKEKYGAGIFTLHLKQGGKETLYLRPSLHPSSVIRCLMEEGIPFDNLTHCQRTASKITPTTYRRSSLYMFYYFALLVAFIIAGCYSVAACTAWGYALGAVSFGLCIYFVYMLLTRFCYLKVDNEALSICSMGKNRRYLYADVLKVNFDFAREQTFTHVMEVLDKEYHYHLYYIGRVSRRTLNEIAQTLQSAGIDATCSLNEDKRFYDDTHMHH